MKVASVLLAAGRGERLRPLTDRVPKAAVPLLDVPLAAFSLKALAACCSPVLVNVSRLGEIITAALQPFVPRGASLEVLVEQPEPYGSAGTLRALAHRIDARVVTCNADVLSDLDPAALLEKHFASQAPATVAVAMVERGADFKVGGDRAVRFVDRRKTPEAAGAQFVGMAVFEKAALDLIPETTPISLGGAVLRPLADAGELALHVHDGYWLDVGTIERYLSASADLLHGVGPPPASGRDGWPGRIVEVEGGLAYLGDGARADADSLGPDAILLAWSTVSPGARVERAIVWPDEIVPPGVNVSDAVWAAGTAVS